MVKDFPKLPDFAVRFEMIRVCFCHFDEAAKLHGPRGGLRQSKCINVKILGHNVGIPRTMYDHHQSH